MQYTEYPEAQDPTFDGPCPDCKGPIPSAANKGQFPGALSRRDNATYICSDCGRAEAMFNFMAPGRDLPDFGTVPMP